MARGGSRQGAGRKSTWASGCTFKDTTLIRVPSKLAPKLLEIAHKLDAGETIDSVTKPDNQELELVDCNLTSIEDTQPQEIDSVTKSETPFTNKESDLVTKTEVLSDKPKQGLVDYKKEKPQTHLQLELFTGLTEPSFDLKSILSNPVPEKLLLLRLGIAAGALNNKRKKNKSSLAIFYAWLKKKDPNEIQWKAAEEPKCYLPDENTPPDLLKELQKWLEKNK